MIDYSPHITRIIPNGGYQTRLYEKKGNWYTTCPNCGNELDVGQAFVTSGELPVCCGWAFKIFDRSKNPPQFEPRWQYIEPLKEV